MDRTAVTKHLQNIYLEGELNKNSTCSKMEHVQNEGSRTIKREVEYYNLDAILSVGYRVNSAQATQFRIWATERLKEYIIKDFTMDDERLKDPRHIFGKDYFEDQLAREIDVPHAADVATYCRCIVTESSSQDIIDISENLDIIPIYEYIKRPKSAFQR